MHSAIAAKVLEYFHHYGLAGSRVVAAVSGGPDSMCLLHALTTLRHELDIDVSVAHFNHQLRADESDRDEDYVKSITSDWGLPCTVGRADVKAYRTANRLNLEEAARDQRYLFLAQTTLDRSAGLLVTAHNRSDQAETVLMHVMRGCGMQGLAGLAPLTSLDVGGKNVRLGRPLLEVARPAIMAYCREAGLKPVEDSSNLDNSPLRNRIRRQLLPLIEQDYLRGVSDGLVRLSTLVRDDLDYLDRQADEIMPRLVSRSGNSLSLGRADFIALHNAMKGRILRACVLEITGTLKDVESRHIAGMIDLAAGSAGRSLALPYGLTWTVGYHRCWLGKPADLPCPYPSGIAETALALPGRTDCGSGSVFASFIGVPALEDVRQKEPFCAYLDADVAGDEMVIRSWREGEDFYPLGLGGVKKVARYLNDEHVPRHWRARIPVVDCGGRIAWVVGQQIDERFKVSSATRRMVKIEYRANDGQLGGI